MGDEVATSLQSQAESKSELSREFASSRVAKIRAKRKEHAQERAAVAAKAFGYIRVSTEEQAAHGHGLDAQDRAIRSFAESQGYELLDVFSDPGVSGATKPGERPGYGSLIGRAKECSILLVWKFDRLARNIVYAVTAVSELADCHNVAIRSVTEPIDTATAMGRTIFAVLAGMAEQERHSITERTWSGRREKASKGGFAGGSAPYGYERDREGGIVPVASEAAIVRRIVEMRDSGTPYLDIAETLNAEGVPGKRGGRWSSSTIRYILDNPKYRGAVEYLFRWNGAEQHVLQNGSHEAIIR